MSDIVTVTILRFTDYGTEKLSSQYNLLFLDIIKAVNRIPSAEIVLSDGNPAQQKYEISDSEFFRPGSKILISLRHESEQDNNIVFMGYVVKHSLQASPRKSTLTLYLKDPVIKLTQRRNNSIFRNQDDVAIIKNIIQTAIDQDKQRNIFDLKLNIIRPNPDSVVHQEMVQFYCSDWDFILSRAAANGVWILVEEGNISVQSPWFIEDGGKPIELEYGRSEIFDLEVEADIREQYISISAIGWDSQTQDLSQPQAGKDYELNQDELEDPATLGKTIGADQYQLISGTELGTKELKDWASARTLQQRLALFRGRIRIAGRADLQLGSKLVLKKFGRRFRGETIITGIRHQVSEAGWQTDIQFGLSPLPFASDNEVMEAPANRLLPAVHGLQIGIVVETSNDSDGLKVRVKVPCLAVTTAAQPSEKHNGLVWARLATLEAGLTNDGSHGRGTMFRPEPGDEVILGFVNDDPRQAVILGALNSVKNKPPFPVTVENNQRGLVTKENLKIVLDDQTKSIHLETPATNHILMMDKEGISIVDEHENQVIMNADGIQIKSGKDVEISAQGNVILKGENLDVK